MNWNFTEIFKKLEVNTLVLAGAITGWILFYLYPGLVVLLGIAILCSAYCCIRFLVFCFHKIQSIFQKRKQRKDRKIIQRLNDEEEEKKAKEVRAQAQLVFDRLSEENKEILRKIVKNEERSIYENVFIVRDRESLNELVYPLKHLIYNDANFSEWVSLDETPDSVLVKIVNPFHLIIANSVIE